MSRLDLATARAVAANVKREVGDYCSVCETAGSVRRGRPEVHDVDLVLVATDLAAWAEITGWAKRVSVAGTSVRAGAQIVSFTGAFSVDGIPLAAQVDLNRATKENFGMMLLAKTGSKEHNIWMAQRAKTGGRKFCPTRGIESGGNIIAGRSEGEVFRALRLAFVEPKDREMAGAQPRWMR